MNKVRTTSFQVVIICVFILLNAMAAFAAPSRTTYQARIVKPDGYPLEASNVNFQFTILDPSSSCILYTETFSAVNMGSSAGFVSFSLGSGVRTFPVSGSTFEQVFSNSTASLTCNAGGPGTYSPQANDTRRIVMQFNDGGGWQTLPAMTINAVPYAMYANDSLKFNGRDVTDFVQVASLEICDPGEAMHYNGAGFTCITATGGSVTSSSVITALGYTPAAATSFTSVASGLNDVSATVFSVSSTVASLTGDVSSLQSSVAASFAAVTSSQWVTSGTGIYYNSGSVGIGTSTPVTLLDVGGWPEAPAGLSTGANVTGNLYVGNVGSGVARVRLSSNIGGGFLQWNRILTASGAMQIDSTKPSFSFGLNGNGDNFNFQRSPAASTTLVSLMTLTGSGSLGIGITTPVTTLDVSGGVRIGLESAGCTTALAGTLRYNGGAVEYCNGVTWSAFGVSGSGLTLLNGSASNTQTFATGSSGVAPLFNTANGVHTLNIPFASQATTTAGLISHSDYLNFSNKLEATSAAVNAALGFAPANAVSVTTLTSTVASLSTTTAASFAAITSSQWTTSASTIFYDIGNVGIGVSNPTARLDLRSESSDKIIRLQYSGTSFGTQPNMEMFRSRGTINNPTGVLANDTLGSISAGGHDGSSFGPGSAAAIQFKANNIFTPTSRGSFISFWTTASGSTTNSERVRISDSGNVGIGATVPTAALHVKAGTSTTAPVKLTTGPLLASPENGAIEYDGSYYYITDSTNSRRVIATVAAPGAFDGTNTISNSSGNITLYPNSGAGSVIVSATTASTNSSTGALIVNGGAGIAGALNVDGNVAVSGSIISSYGLVSTTALGQNQGDVVEMQRWAGQNGNINYLDVRHLRTVSGTTWFSAASRIQQKVDSTWMGYLQFNGDDNLYGISFGTGSTTAAPGNTPERLRITSTGNVGIGTSAPTARLEVAGNLKVNSSGANLFNTVRSVTNSGNSVPFDNGLFRIQMTNTKDSAGTSNTIMGYVLHSTDELNGSPITSFKSRLGGFYGQSHRGFESEVHYNDTNAYHFLGRNGLNAEDTFWVTAGYTSNMYVKGNVGIGTSSPTMKLNVNGRVMAEGLNNGYWWSSDGTEDAWHAHIDSSRNFKITESGVTDRFVILKGGNVGVGTTTPTEKFSVAASATNNTYNPAIATGAGTGLSQGGTIGSRMASSNVRQGLKLYSPVNLSLHGRGSGGIATNPAIQFQTGTLGDESTDANTVMTILNSGNVGIGTTAPTGKLFVGSDWRTTHGGASLYLNATRPGGAATPNLGITYSVSNSGTTDPLIPGMTLYNDDVTAGGWTPMLTFAKAESGVTPFKTATAAIGSRSPTGTANSDSWIDGELYFYTSGASTQGLTPRMIISSSGNVGIGTTTPTEKFSIASGNIDLNKNYGIGESIGTSSEYMIYPYRSAITSMGTYGLYAPYEFGMSLESDGIIALVETDANDLRGYFDVNANEFIWSGKVGFGTAAPSASLHVSGTMRLTDGNQAAGRVLASDANGNAAWKQVIVAKTGTLVANSSTASGQRVSAGYSLTLPPGRWKIEGMGITTTTSCRANFGIRTTGDSVVKYTMFPAATGDFQTASVMAYVDISTTTSYELYISSRDNCTSQIHTDPALWEFVATGVAY